MKYDKYFGFPFSDKRCKKSKWTFLRNPILSTVCCLIHPSSDEKMKMILHNTTLVVNEIFARQYEARNNNNKSGVMKLDLLCTTL